MISAGAVAGAGGVGGGGTAAGAGAIGFNEIRNTVRATVSGTTLNSNSFVTISATENARIKAVSVGIAGTLAGGMGVGIGLSGAGSGSKNNIYNVVEAQILADSIVTSGTGFDVEVTATDTAEIGSFAGALAFAITGAIASLGLAVGISKADNDIGNIVRAKISDSTVTAGEAVEVTASSTAKIVAGAAAGGIGVSVTSAVGVGAALSSNNIHNTIEAIVEDSDLADSPAQAVTGRSVSVKAESDADILSTGLGLSVAISGGVSIGIGFVESNNTITNTTLAEIRNLRVVSTVGAVDVLAFSSGPITETPTAAAVAAAGAAISGGGVLSKNTVTPQTTASINGGSSVSGATHVKVEAKDESTIDATIVAVSVAAGSNAIAVGISRAENTIGGSITASVSGSSVTALGGALDGDIDILASANQTVTTFSVLLSAAFGAIAAAGAGAETDEKIQPNVTASVTGGTLTATGNNVNVHAKFTGFSDPKTAAVSGSVGFGGALSVVKADALISGTTSAFAAGGTINAAKLSVDAHDISTSTAFALSVGLSTGVALAATKATSKINRTTEAYLAAGTINTSGGPVDVHATSSSKSDLDGASIAAGFAAVSLVLLDSTVATTTRAYVGDGANVTSGALDVKADAFNIVTSTSVNLSISLGGGNETFITATDDSTIEARLGPAKAATSGSAAITASGDVNATTMLTSRAVGRAIGHTFGLCGTIGDMHGKPPNKIGRA
jgi:hypothetical protein